MATVKVPECSRNAPIWRSPVRYSEQMPDLALSTSMKHNADCGWRKYVPADLYDAETARADAAEANLAKAMGAAFFEGYRAGNGEIEELEARLAKAVEALEECQAEIDEYIRHEYPGDHPVQERYRRRDFSANPARIALAAMEGGDE